MEALRCNGCNASLDIDFNNMIAYCPYCGSKLMFDIEQVRRILERRIKEEQATLRVKIKEEEATERQRLKVEHRLARAQLEMEEKKRIEQLELEKKKADAEEIKVAGRLIIFLFSMAFFGCFLMWIMSLF